MCEENDHYIDVEWTPLVEDNTEETFGNWDIVASFSQSDEVILEQMMELPIAKVMIQDYYAPLYAHKAQLSIRRRMRPFKTKHDREQERLIDYHHELTP